MNRSRLITYLQLGFGMAIFGSGTPVSKLVTDGFPVFIASGIWMAIVAVVLFPLVTSEYREPFALQKRDWRILVLIALIGMFLFSITMLYGMKMVSGVVGSIVMCMTPAVTAFAAYCS